MMVQIYNFSTQEAKAGRSKVHSQPEQVSFQPKLHNDTLSQKKKKRGKRKYFTLSATDLSKVSTTKLLAWKASFSSPDKVKDWSLFCFVLKSL
jgi:hypothetical protein